MGAEVVEDAFLSYRAHGVRLPPVPRDLAGQLREISVNSYATDDIEVADLAAFLAAARDPATAPLVAFGPNGGGVNSWWLCYQLIEPRLALFLRLPFGGVDSSDAQAREIVNTCFYRAEELVARIDAGPARAGRLIVVVDAREDSFVVLGSHDEPTLSADAIGDALATLAAM
jgi:hypothetical protein